MDKNVTFAKYFDKFWKYLKGKTRHRCLKGGKTIKNAI
jgi:hypothetical protein